MYKSLKLDPIISGRSQTFCQNIVEPLVAITWVEWFLFKECSHVCTFLIVGNWRNNVTKKIKKQERTTLLAFNKVTFTLCLSEAHFSLQGFFIFIMHVFRSADVRTAYLRKKQKWETRKINILPSSRSVARNSNVWSEKLTMGKLCINTESPGSMVRRHQILPIDSGRMKTRESCLTPVNL